MTKTLTKNAPTTAPGLRIRRYRASLQSPLVCAAVLELVSFEFRDRHQLYLILGLMIAYEMSTNRFTSTNTIARNRIPPCSAG